jgi:hypothetical protein
MRGDTMQWLRSMGYTVSRVFINADENGVAKETELPEINAQYIENFLDFLTKARENQIRVIVTHQWASLNFSNAYIDRSNNIGGTNGLYLNPMHVQGNAAFFAALARAIVGHGLEDTVFAYDLVNEGEFDTNEAPLNWNSGGFLAPNGATYNMGSSLDKERMMNDNTENWINVVDAAVKAIHPEALTSASLFAANLVQGTSRRPFVLAAVAKSTVNYLDTHNYAQSVFAVSEEIRSLGIPSLMSKKPLLMGEFGSMNQNSLAMSAELQAAQFNTSCSYAYRGWLWWTLDTGLYGGESTIWRSLMQDGGAMNGQFAPSSRTAFTCNVKLPAYEHVACFNETAYLRRNADVMNAVKSGGIASGYQHFLMYGNNEGRDGCSN